MYGSKCLGVVIPANESLGSFISFVIKNMEWDERDSVAAAIKNVQMDVLGMGMIVYFPGIPYFDEEEYAKPFDHVDNAFFDNCPTSPALPPVHED
jgi:hypothetical protein